MKRTNKVETYSIRKFKVGVSSALIGLSFLGATAALNNIPLVGNVFGVGEVHAADRENDKIYGVPIIEDPDNQIGTATLVYRAGKWTMESSLPAGYAIHNVNSARVRVYKVNSTPSNNTYESNSGLNLPWTGGDGSQPGGPNDRNRTGTQSTRTVPASYDIVNRSENNRDSFPDTTVTLFKDGERWYFDLVAPEGYVLAESGTTNSREYTTDNNLARITIHLKERTFYQGDSNFDLGYTSASRNGGITTITKGTKPTVTRTPIDFNTSYIKDESREKGSENITKTEGRAGEIVRTVRHTVDRNTGVVSDSPEEETRVEPVNKVVKVAAKDKVVEREGHDGNQETTLKVSDGLSNKENFDTYKFDRTEEASNGDRIHHYNKLYTILRDEKGNEIKRIPGIVGEDAFSNLPGYKLIRVDTDENGNKIPIYHKIQTKFVSHDKGKETILKIVDGEVEKENLKGQKFVRTETLNNGDRVHHYNKTYTISTDDKGNELGRVIGTDGKPMELPGYKLIRVDHDENGNLIPIYHKIQTFYKGHDGTEVIDLEVVDNLADKKDFSGYKFDKTEEVENGDRIHHYVKLHTIYRDENGNELSRDHSINGELRDLPGYKLIRVDTDENGNKIPVYHKLVTRFVTMENDKEIELKVEDGLVEKSDIKNYRYVKTTEDKTLGDRIHHYEPLYTILRDENGNEIGRIKGVVEPEEKPGYKLIRVDTDENGNKIPIYHKIQTKFVSSENGQDELLKTVDGTVEKEEIEGYQFTKSEVDETLGDTIHHYSPLYTILKDENGRVIKTIKGIAEPEDLPGYKLIRVDTDSEGNKVPVYHKIQTKFVYEEDGKEVVIKTLDGTQPDEKLDGFNYLKTSVDEKLGDTIHYYQKVESNKEDEEWTVIKDEIGKVIKRIKGRLKESDLENYLPGYKLMRIERDDNGNLTPIYHKILTQFVTERNGKPFILKTLEGTHEKEEIDGYEFESTNVDDATGDTIHHYKLKPKTVEQKESVKTGASASSFVLPGVGILGLIGALSFAGYKHFKKRKN